jgi:glycosyltransferase involved in cell wall biosynthesis
MKIVNWQKILTFHQFYFWKSFEGLVNNEILYIINGYESEVRRNQGWSFPDLDGNNVIDLKKTIWLIHGINLLEKNKRAIHIFSGFLSERRYLPLILYAAIRQIRTVVMFEPYSTVPFGYLKEESRLTSILKVKIRPLLYKFIASLINRVSGSNKFIILAISTEARRQMMWAGFKEEQIFPFGYFVPRDHVVKKRQKNKNSQLQFVFVGSMIGRKGLDIAFEAFKLLSLNGYNVFLDCYGSGDFSIISSNIPSIVRHKGGFQYGEAQRVISNYDALLLPSRHDGWGVVVNEALLQGVPAIVSDHVGASVLLKNSGAGVIFESENISQLYDAIVNLLEHPEVLEKMRISAENIGVQITPDVASHYLHRVLNFYFFKEKEPFSVIWDQFKYSH